MHDSGAVLIEIECEDEEDSFHRNFAVEKYRLRAEALQLELHRRLADAGVPCQVVVNPGPGEAWLPCSSLKRYFVLKAKQSVQMRYPRLGAFEVWAHLPQGFSPLAGAPARLQVWSKLESRRWPHTGTLAGTTLRLLSAAREGQDVLSLQPLLHCSSRQALPASTGGAVRRPLSACGGRLPLAAAARPRHSERPGAHGCPRAPALQAAPEGHRGRARPRHQRLRPPWPAAAGRRWCTARPSVGLAARAPRTPALPPKPRRGRPSRRRRRRARCGQGGAPRARPAAPHAGPVRGDLACAVSHYFR
ncbi:unnamed protein product [Prorocentrum cordatum]|uniref:Uncharacterized protein n=1 Tax=Prorocentrum cordatum TaxID=2364126 RepID=A0ABN9TQL2_9DINO|nr:unnamed protein product [Polarella glacialis]